MNVLIISNCQGETYAACMRAVNPTLSVKHFLMVESELKSQALIEAIQDSDYVFVQNGTTAELKELIVKKPHFEFPGFAFTGLHPDMTYVRAKNKETGKVEVVHSLMVSYHSSIAVLSYQMGLPVDQAVGFFNHHVYNKLGYFDEWSISKKETIDLFAEYGLYIEDAFLKWEKQGCFMHTLNHPCKEVIFDISIMLMNKLNIEVMLPNAGRYVSDPLALMPVWPVYNELAVRRGIKGEYIFKRHAPHGLISLEDFVRDSFENYDKYERDTIETLNFSLEDYKARLGFSGSVKSPASVGKVGTNPYRHLPPHHFWKTSVAQVDYSALDPVVNIKFGLKKTDKIATAGSCFAQHIAKTLSKEGYNYFVTEQALENMSPEEALSRNYGVFSARYGNLYTSRQLLQLVQRAYGLFTPEDHAWVRVKDGHYIDPFRPQIEPNGFENLEALAKDRDIHFAEVRRMIEQMDVFVFTFGLTEGWQSIHDGAVFPLAPGVAGSAEHLDRYEFVNFSADEIRSDFYKFLDLLRQKNPKCRVIVTVSPVPLIATYENQHALVATTYSKSVLRVVANDVAQQFDFIDYFPSYEIIVGHYNKGVYFQEDLRSVNPMGVNHVMSLFKKHYLCLESANSLTGDKPVGRENPDSSNSFRKVAYNVVCDEEAITNF